MVAREGKSMKVFHLFDAGFIEPNKFFSIGNWYYAAHCYPWVLFGLGHAVMPEKPVHNYFLIINIFGKRFEIMLGKERPHPSYLKKKNEQQK